MKKFTLILILSIPIILLSCHKNGQSIDVSSQWFVDDNRNRISGPVDGQWQPTAFTSQEMNLFNGLDTADLTGTLMPDSVFTGTSCYNCIFPNPFTSEAAFSFNFSNGFNGQMVFKFIIVNNQMNTVDEGAMRILGTSYPNIPMNPST